MLNERVSRASAEGAISVPGGSGEKHEVELKLLVPAGALDQVRAAPVVARHARNAGVVRRLEAVYYDTPDHALLSRGLSLRVRRHGNRHVQTLKRGPAPGQPFVRGEWEATLDGTAPDLALLPKSEIGAPLDALVSQALDPIFVTKVRRRTQLLDVRGTVVEIAIDQGSIEAGERCEPLTEIELEVKAGDARALYEIGIELLAAAPLRIGVRSKADRGYDLAFGLAPKATRATATAITAAHTLDDVVGVLLATCQHQVLANQSVAEAGRDPEGVHQMRVALRRLRTACAVLRRELGSPQLQAFSAEGKWFATLLGAARNWDVFVGETLSAPSAALASDTVDFDGLRQAAEPHRHVAYAALREALAGQRYNRFQLSLRHWIESRGWRNELGGRSLGVLLDPAPSFTGRALTWLHRKALDRGAHFRSLGPEERHQLRIGLKKLRYAAEFFRELYSEGEARSYIGCLARLQDALGHDNDASMTWPLLCTLLQNPSSPEVQRTVGVVMGWQARDRVDTKTTLREHWRRFKATPSFWPA
jgi:inorganic triphosphatase YgiF